MFEFLADNNKVFVAAHVLTMGIGLGAVTITDILFFKFLKDLTISDKESDTLSALSNVIWIMLILATITGLGLYLPNAAGYNESPKFLLKVTVVAVILLNGILLNVLIGPRLSKIFPDRVNFADSSRLIRRLAFAGGGISLTSWYTAFVLGNIKHPGFTYWQGLGAYGAILLGAILISQLVEHSFHQKKG